MNNLLEDRFRGCLLGLAVGDALGAPVEFSKRYTYELRGMEAGGPFNLKAGQWTDDTSMALCLASSLLRGSFDAKGQMDQYVSWYKHGHWSSTGKCFDIGATTTAALEAYIKTGDAERSGQPGEGNGALMRLAPAILWAYPDESMVITAARLSTGYTHASAVCRDASVVLATVIYRALRGDLPDYALLIPLEVVLDLRTVQIRNIAEGSFARKDEGEIRSTGWAVHTLEAALWAVHGAENFKEALLRAVNLGGDTDTIGAVTGQIAGALWGESGIPPEWLEVLTMKKEIADIAMRFVERVPEQGGMTEANPSEESANGR